MDLEKVLNNPLIHSFRTKENYYLYDAPSNEIIRTDSLTYKVFNKEININKINYKGIIRRIKLLERLLEKGIFSISKFDCMGFQLDTNAIKENLKNKIQEITLNVTEDCNFRCKYCAYSGLYKYQRTHSNKSMSEKIAKGAIDFFNSVSEKSPVVYVGFYGGEPLSNFDLIKKVIQYGEKKLNKKEKFWAITNNGSLIDKDRFYFLTSKNVLLNVSLDGPKKIHDTNRINIHNAPTFDLVYHNLKKLRDYNKEYYNKNVNFAITLSPKSSLLGIVHFFSTDELVKNHTYFINNVGKFDTNFFNFSPVTKENYEKFEREFKIIKKMYIESIVEGRENKFLSSFFRKRLKLIHNRARSLTKIIKPNGMCIPGLKKIFISTDGRFYPCERVGESFEIGNIKKGLDSKKIFELINNYIELSSEDCTKCWASHFCNLCLSGSREGNEISIERKREQCRDIKNMVNESLVMYCSILEKNPKAFDNFSSMEFFEN